MAGQDDIGAIEELVRLYSSRDSEYFDIDKAIRIAEMAKDFGYENATQYLFMFHAFEEYRPQTKESLKKATEYGMRCLESGNLAVPYELTMSVMLDCYREIGCDMQCAKEGYRQMFICLRNANIEYSDEKNLNLLKESIHEIYCHLGYDDNGNECFPR